MNQYQQIFEQLTQDSRYRVNLDWGKPRPGHPEGTVRAHIAQLENNLAKLCAEEQPEYWKLMILIHVHDSFKKEAKKGVAIVDPRSHASLASSFLSEFCDEPDLLAMVQYHDEPYALYRQECLKGTLNTKRFESLLATIKDWNLFGKFLLIDGYTPGKDPRPLEWILRSLAPRKGLAETMTQWLQTLSKGAKLEKVG